MATYDLEEQEQLEELKTWWKLHGRLVGLAVATVAVLMVGWQGWQWWQKSQSAQASHLYGGLQRALQQQDVKQVRVLAGELIDKYARTPYAGMAAMLSGKALAESGDRKSAQAQFGWAAGHANDPGLRDLARLRQAIILTEDRSYDEALKLLTAPAVPSLMPRYHEVRGDVLSAQGQSGEAVKAYDEALSALAAARKMENQPEGPYQDVLQAKRDAMGAKS